MFYYLVEGITIDVIEGGRIFKEFRPNYEGSFVWNPDAVCPHCNTYIIGLPSEVESLKPVTDLESACFARNLPVSDVVTWFVGDN